MNLNDFLERIKNIPKEYSLFIENIGLEKIKDNNDRVILDNNFVIDESEIENIKIKNDIVYLKTDKDLITIPKDYFYYLIWREDQNNKKYERLKNIINSINDINLKTELLNAIKEENINPINYLNNEIESI